MRWKWRPSGRVYLLRWVRINGHDFERVRYDVVYLPDDRLRRRKRVCGRSCAARRL